MLVRTLIVALILSLGLASLGSSPAVASHGRVTGVVTDSVTGQPIAGVCVAAEPPITCTATTDGNGHYRIDWLVPDGLGFRSALNFLKAGEYNAEQRRDIPMDQVMIVNVAMNRIGGTPPPPPPPPPPAYVCPTERTGTPTRVVYLPNITKTLGGPDGWQTPFIVQNIGAVATDIEVSFSSFETGACAYRTVRTALQPGTSQAYSPNHLAELPHGGQFSVVVKSFGADVVAVVNQHQGSDDRSEAMSYSGISQGATSVFLPNIVRRFHGFQTPLVIQNVGTAQTTATARFVPFGGGAEVTMSRTVNPGQSAAISPNHEDQLADGARYAVTVTAAQPVGVIVNTHNDDPGVAQPMAYSTNGITAGGASVFGAYAAKNTDNVGRISTIVVQNMGTTAVTPAIAFTSMGSAGTPFTFTKETPLAAGAAWEIDPRFRNGDTRQPLCIGPGGGCLPDGEYSFVVTGAGGTLAAAVNVISQATAMGYMATGTPATRYFLPNVTRTLGGANGWTTPIYLQSSTAGGATLTWRRFADGQTVQTQTVSLTGGSAVRIDPRNVAGLTDDTQYAVEVVATGGTVSAIVVQLATGGDNAMIYEGFRAP